MSTLSLTDKLRILCEHHKVGANTNKMSKMHKALQDKFPGKTPNALYDELPKSVRDAAESKNTAAAVVPVAAPASSAAAVEKAKDGEIIPPGQPLDLRVDGATQHTNVAAPSLTFHLAPASIAINPGNVSWAYTLQRAAMYTFVFFSGSMLGVLTTLALFRKVI